jgi:hypothetical protein
MYAHGMHRANLCIQTFGEWVAQCIDSSADVLLGFENDRGMTSPF